MSKKWEYWSSGSDSYDIGILRKVDRHYDEHAVDRLFCTVRDEETAKKIVTAVNNHAELLAACEKAFDCLTGGDTLESQSHPESPYDFLYAAIKKARGE